ncbi:hypothetical protein CSB93_2075 [Pseudomonas paraeruginosa]|uniref:Uncharacterized protein n=1 Tax=Pseudomonas paraeruginosa TaxID=2994495 RepID=A0A2R3J2G3_9PSED|nr:hypothetical protein CSB93_2075 [Pseudomonas paraeruginosa]AWE90077.1 hypothetical protein CSC28_0841 [Pseudomonas paraeruginosa]
MWRLATLRLRREWSKFICAGVTNQGGLHWRSPAEIASLWQNAVHRLRLDGHGGRGSLCDKYRYSGIDFGNLNYGEPRNLLSTVKYTLRARTAAVPPQARRRCSPPFQPPQQGR